MKSRQLFGLLSIVFLMLPAMAGAQGTGPNLPWADISGQKERQVVIAAGTPELYNGHPTTLLMDDGNTMVCTWSLNHGGPAAFIGWSHDGGVTWQNAPAPKEWEGLVNCPSIYQLADKAGKERLFVFATMETGRAYRNMAYSFSEDGGKATVNGFGVQKVSAEGESMRSLVTGFYFLSLVVILLIALGVARWRP